MNMNLSIVIPVYNSSKIIKTLVSKIEKKLKKKIKFEIILINDNSKDDSWDIIKQISKKKLFVKGVNLSKNHGQHKAIYTGLRFARGDVIVTMDDDMQHPPEYVFEIYKKVLNNDICYTNYLKRKHIFWKRTVSYVNNLFASLLFNKPLNVYMSSFRGFKKKISKKILKKKSDVVFLDSMLLRESKIITKINVIHKKRLKGESTYKLKELFSLWFDMIKNFHFLPFRFGSIIGLVSKIIIMILEKLFNRSETDSKVEIKEKTF